LGIIEVAKEIEEIEKFFLYFKHKVAEIKYNWQLKNVILQDLTLLIISITSSIVKKSHLL